jgi:hypothetical protein
MPYYSESEDSEYDYGGRLEMKTNKKIIPWDIAAEKGFQHVNTWLEKNKPLPDIVYIPPLRDLYKNSRREQQPTLPTILVT